MTEHTTPPPATPGPLCASFAPLLPLLGAGLLTDDEATATRAHLAGCAWCRTQRAAQDVVDSALRRHYAAVPATLSTPPLRLEDIMRDADRPDHPDHPDHSGHPDDTPSIPSAPAATSATPPPGGPRHGRALLGPIAAALVVALFAGLFYAVHTSTGPATQPIATKTSVPAATAIPSPTASPTVSVTVAALPACQTSQLTVTMDNSGVAMGHVSERFHFTNSSAQACALDGYPTLLLLDAQQQPMPTHLTQTTQAYTFTTQAPQQVALAPQANGYFSVEWSDMSDNGQGCPASDTASYLRVTPPNQSSGLLVSGTLVPCGGNLIVSPVQATAF